MKQQQDVSLNEGGQDAVDGQQLYDEDSNRWVGFTGEGLVADLVKRRLTSCDFWVPVKPHLKIEYEAGGAPIPVLERLDATRRDSCERAREVSSWLRKYHMGYLSL